MGLLDDAIREHLDLKRRRGADPTEIERAEREALGPVRRGPEVTPEDGTVAESTTTPEAAAEPAPAEQWAAEPFDAEADFHEPAPALEDEAALAAYEPEEPLEDDPFQARRPFDEEAEPAPPPHPADLSPAPEPEPSLAPASEDSLPGTSPHLDQETEEYELEPEEEEGDDVLESTPEFLQDAPDHDRLWFEQRPPRDFDFDG
jgi:hypothetical protein